MYKELKCDILIIGSGAAGLRCAIEAYDSGTKDLILLGKCKRGDAHTVLATGGINAALATMDLPDSWLIHAADTLREGEEIADYRDVVFMCRDAPRAVMELVGWGARFHREKDGRLTQRFFGAHTYRRTCFYGDQTGKEMIRVLIAQVTKRKIRIRENIYIFSLLKDKGRIAGALGIDLDRGEFVLFRAKAVVLAAGGYTKVYSRSSSRAYENQGDGAGLALELGVDLVDMEMVQFHPTGMVYPKEAEGVLVTEAVRGEGGVLLNSKLERFMKRYDPKRLELGPRDLVSRAVYNEIQEGTGTKHGGVWLDITSMPKSKILDRLPKIYAQFKQFVGIDISKDRMEVAPTAHYTMGGVDVSLQGETSIKGLFAVGETVGKIHGANRLGGNSLLETVVFGRVVGREVSKFSKTNKLCILEQDTVEDKIKQVNEFFNSKEKNESSIRKQLQETMWKYVGIVRNENQMKKGLLEIRRLRKEFKKVKVKGGLKNNVDLKMALETSKMFDVCEAVVKSAMLRKESRGAHFRSDYPKRNDARWMINILSRSKNGSISLNTRKVKKIRGAFAKNLSEKIEVLPHQLLE